MKTFMVADAPNINEERLAGSVDFKNIRLYQKENNSRTPTLQQLIHAIGFPVRQKLCLPTQKGFTIIKMEEILYCEAQKSYTLIRLTNSKAIVISKPLIEYDKLLDSSIFFRVHKSFLINLLHIKEYIRGEGGSVVMSNGMEIEVSRRKKEQFIVKVKAVFKY